MDNGADDFSGGDTLAAARQIQARAAFLEARITGGEPTLLRDRKRGFRHFGEFAKAIRASPNDERLRIIAAAPSTYGSEQDGPDGGFAVPPTFAAEIGRYILAGDSLTALCDQQQTTTNSQAFPTDESPPWSTTVGIRAAWQPEGTAFPQVKPVLRSSLMRLVKLGVLVPLSDEILSDAATLNTYLPGECGEALAWMLDDAIVKGLGNGTPLGILNAPATLVQAKDSGQATLTFSITNATNMLSRLPPGSHSRAVWLCHASALPVLLSMGQSASGYPIFKPDDILIRGTNIPAIGLLLGRPVILTHHTNVFSSQGDVVLADLSYYRVLTKPRGVDTALSLHMFFDADCGAYRATLRCMAQPWITAPLTPPAGGTTVSPFIQLAAR